MRRNIGWIGVSKSSEKRFRSHTACETIRVQRALKKLPTACQTDRWATGDPVSSEKSSRLLTVCGTIMVQTQIAGRSEIQ